MIPASSVTTGSDSYLILDHQVKIPEPRSPCALTLAGASRTEAWIERIQSSGGSVIVTLSLADGSRGRSVVASDCADWLDLRPGQIVTVEGDVSG